MTNANRPASFRKLTGGLLEGPGIRIRCARPPSRSGRAEGCRTPVPGLGMRGNFVAYYRVSTDRQGRSGLGLEAQQKAVQDYLNGGDWSLVAELTEVETGKRSDRPELTKALALSRKHKAKLVIAKLDRLSRNLAFIATMMDSGVEFVAVDNPHANKLTLHILRHEPCSGDDIHLTGMGAGGRIDLVWPGYNPNVSRGSVLR
jgi:hypothetical protein